MKTLTNRWMQLHSVVSVHVCCETLQVGFGLVNVKLAVALQGQLKNSQRYSKDPINIVANTDQRFVTMFVLHLFDENLNLYYIICLELKCRTEVHRTLICTLSG